MKDLRWLATHIGTLEDGINLIDEFFWNITVENHNGEWFVKGGEKVLLHTDSKDTVDSFIYGMALAYTVLPEELKQKFRTDFDPR